MRRRAFPILAALMAAVMSCDQATAPAEELTLLSVVPADGAVGIDPTASPSIQFSHPMRSSMSEYAALHQGQLSGPLVPGRWEWSDDHTMMIFHPHQPLEHQTTYFLHVGGGMQDMRGRYLDYEDAMQHFGGEWCTDDHLGGMMNHREMGPGWRHRNGTYGMVLSFTTG